MIRARQIPEEAANVSHARIARRLVGCLVITLAALACGRIPLLGARQGAIPEIPFAGDRPDAPPLAERGNAVFSAASFDDTGELLVTQPFMGPEGIQVWDAVAGKLLTRIDGSIPDRTWMIDSRRQRLLGTKAPSNDLVLFDLRTGKEISRIPAGTDSRPARAAGLAAGGNEVLLFKPSVVEVWQLDPPELVRQGRSPLSGEHYVPGCVGGLMATYNQKSCWEWSPDRRTIALAYTPVFSPISESQFFLLDVTTLEFRQLELPTKRESRTLASFAFSPDGSLLALGTDQELLVYDRRADRWSPPIAGDHRRNRYLGAMSFTVDGSRVSTLGDQLQVSVFDVNTGARVGRKDPPDWDWEGEFRSSADGSRIVNYHFVSDTFEVLDGRDARPIGTVCPYFCNQKHNPVQPAYAVSGDGASVAISHRRGTAVWDVATNKLKFALMDPKRERLKE